MEVEQLVHAFVTIGDILGIEPISVFITVEDEHFPPEELCDEELKNILELTYKKLSEHHGKES